MDENLEEFQGFEEMFTDIDQLDEKDDIPSVEGMDLESIDFNDEFDENDEDCDDIEEPIQEFSPTMSFDDYEFETNAFD